MITRKNQKLFLILISFITLNAFADSKFDGAYAGIDLGYVNADSKGTTYQDGRGDDPGPTGWSFKSSSIDSALIGGFVGVNKVLDNNVLLGIEANYELRNGDKETLLEHSLGFSNAIYSKSKLRNAASVRAKLGYIFNNNQTLAYITAGYAAAELKLTTMYDESISDSSNWHNGWTAGFGAEHFINDKISLKGEYRYSDYNTEKYSVNVSEGTYMYGWYHNAKLESENALRFGIAYHF